MSNSEASFAAFRTMLAKLDLRDLQLLLHCLDCLAGDLTRRERGRLVALARRHSVLGRGRNGRKFIEALRNARTVETRAA